jgi:endogenous inhibitor of DNA gyrase (YacG/DUF329 family)
MSDEGYVLACPACGARVPFDEVEWEDGEAGRCPECGATSESDEWVEAEAE